MDKIAVIELEQHIATLTIASVKQNEFFTKIFEKEVNLKLGFDVDSENYFKKAQIEEVVSVLKDFHKICDLIGVTKKYCNAYFTAENKPKNLYSFLDEVFATCGLRFNIVDRSQQLNNLYLSQVNTLDITKGFIINVNVDNVRFVSYNRRTVFDEIEKELNIVKLIEECSKNSEQVIDFDVLEKKVNSELKSIQLNEENLEDHSFIGTGKLFKDIAFMVRKFKKYPIEAVHGYVIKSADVEAVYKQIKTLELGKEKVIKGVSCGRADVFAVALAIVCLIIKKFNIEEITISSTDIAIGELLKQSIPSTLEKPVVDLLGYSLNSYILTYESESLAHIDQVNTLSSILFKQLRVLHKLPRSFMKILRTASYLHDSGERVSLQDHAKHSFYVIMNSEILGLTQRELLLSGFVASLHNGGDIAVKDWVNYKDIVSEEDIVATKRLGVILRLAECFDYTKMNAVVDIDCEVLGDSVIMKTVSNGDSKFELKEANLVSKEFEKNYKKKLEIL